MHENNRSFVWVFCGRSGATAGEEGYECQEKKDGAHGERASSIS